MREPQPEEGFVERYGPWAVIAGASEGVGASVAEQLAARGANVVLIARRGERLDDLADRVEEAHGVQARVLVADLTDPTIGRRVADTVADLEVGLLVYNAGAVDQTATFLEHSFESSLALVQLNCIGPLALLRELAPGMRDRGRGGIVLVGSLACLAGAANVAVYSAAKMFGVNLAEGLWAELREHGVDVCDVMLGSVHTAAAARQGVRFDPTRDLLPDQVAREIIANIRNGPTYVVGEANRAIVSGVWRVDRRVVVEGLSAAAADYSSRRRTPREG
jgi:short-subunit dehydrogenase